MSSIFFVYLYPGLKLLLGKQNIEPQAQRCRFFLSVTVRSSPPWHRHLRARRSQARKRLRLGLPTSHSQLLLLAGHHGTCPQQRVRLQSRMGRGRGWDNAPKSAQQGPQPASWQLWRGANSPSVAPWKERPTAPKNPPKKYVFPTYNGAPANAPFSNPAVIPKPISVQETGHLVTDMQSTLNFARKTEARVARLHTAYSQAQEQWEAFETKAKANFQTERRRFHTDLERIEHEAVEAERQQACARELVRAIAIREAQGAPGLVGARFAGWADEDTRTMDGVLQRALGAVIPPSTPQRVTGVPPMTPARTAPEPAPSPAPTSAPTDPYIAASMTSPVGVPATEDRAAGPPLVAQSPGQAPKHPGQRDREQARVATSVAAPRANIKDATKKSPAKHAHVTLEEKLQSRRESLTQGKALKPFGGAGSQPPREPPPGSNLATAEIQDDDLDDSMD